VNSAMVAGGQNPSTSARAGSRFSFEDGGHGIVALPDKRDSAAGGLCMFVPSGHKLHHNRILKPGHYRLSISLH
jgi:hypothetical protein